MFKKMTDDTKTYVFGQDSGVLSVLAPMLSQRGIDPNLLVAMKNNGGFGGEGGWFMWIIFLFFLMGWGNFGYGNRGGEGLANQINNDYGRDLLLQAINGNHNAISQLASTLNCDVNSIQSSLNNISNAVGMSGQQIINSIQSGNCQLASQLAQCCCDNKLLITQQGYENQIATANQTAFLGGKIDNQTTVINDKFCQLEMRELQNKIDTLREEKSTLQNAISNGQQTAAIQQYIASSVNPVLNALQAEVASIKCGLPPTVNVPYSPVIGVPSCFVYQYGLNRLFGTVPASDTPTTTT